MGRDPVEEQLVACLLEAICQRDSGSEYILSVL